MTEPADDADAATAAAEEEARRRRLAEVFGDVLPEGSSDEPRPAGHDDRWYEDNRPPHHGG